jgi:hypothetical protein
MFIKLVLRFALSEFTTLHQFDVPVGVNLCFQAEGLYFERSESKTSDSSASCICFKKFFKMPHTEQRGHTVLFLEKGGVIFVPLVAIYRF